MYTSHRHILTGFPQGMRALLKKIAALAHAHGWSAYIVGGFVRDLLVKRKNYDIDIVVEGDGPALARETARVLQARGFVHYPKFGTATIFLDWPRHIPNPHHHRQLRIDFSTARREIYSAPAALPSVRFATIKEDLARRDFTINALAVCITGDGFGALVDFFGGEADIRNKVVRVLHEKSFRDDPTRIFRAVRFSTRYGFAIDPLTRRIIRRAITQRMFSKLTKQRLREEIILLLSEPDPRRTARAMSALDELRFIHPRVRYDRKASDLFTRIYKTLRWYRTHFPRQPLRQWVLYFGALVAPLGAQRTYTLIREWGFTKSDRTAITAIQKERGRIVRFLSSRVRRHPSDIYTELQGLPREMLIFALAACSRARARKHVYDFLARYSLVSLAVKGRDLRDLGIPEGPAYSMILRTLRREKLDKNLTTKREEMRAVKNIIALYKEKNRAIFDGNI